jgi:hypothetical protein
MDERSVIDDTIIPIRFILKVKRRIYINGCYQNRAKWSGGVLELTKTSMILDKQSTYFGNPLALYTGSALRVRQKDILGDEAV